MGEVGTIVLQLNPTLSDWGVVLTQLRRKSVCWHGNSLSERDLHTYTEAIVLCALHLTDMSLRSVGIGSQREIVAWCHMVVSLDVSAVASFLSDAITLLRNVSECSNYKEFKRSLAHDYPFVGQYCAPIRRVMSSFLEDPNPRDFADCYQFLSFLTHVTLVDLAIDLEPEYEELERSLQEISYPQDLMVEMNSIMRGWMKGFSINEDNFHPCHGPGAVAENTARNVPLTKYYHLGDDALLRYVFKKFAGLDLSTYRPFPPSDWKRQSSVVFVPKSMKTRRTISKEPATLMYYQQGVSAVLVDYIHKHPFLSRHIRLDKQELNAELAIQSSYDHRFATVDLSAASDTVTIQLVKAVFRGTPLYPFLVALRSQTTVLPSGKILRLAKFAPMGSALCFPIETLIFACAVEFAVRRARRTHLGFYPVWRVYGDDIIVSDALFGDIQLVLETLGFKLNASKSFHSPARFRESCGGEGFDGVDVTPMKISRRFASSEVGLTSHHAALYEGLIDLANTAYRYNFSFLRAWVVRVLLDCPVGEPLFSGNPNGTLYSPWPDNFRAPRRFNKNLWRTEIQVVRSISPSLQKWDGDEDLDAARYFETLRLTRNRTGDMFLPEHRVSVPRGSQRPILRKKWVDQPHFEVRS